MLTSDVSRCEYYKKHSFNVEPKGWSYVVSCCMLLDLIITNSAVFLMFRKRKGAVIKPVKNWRTKIHSFPARTCTCIFLKYNLTYKLHLLMLWTL